MRNKYINKNENHAWVMIVTTKSERLTSAGVGIVAGAGACVLGVAGMEAAGGCGLELGTGCAVEGLTVAGTGVRGVGFGAGGSARSALFS